MTFTKWSDLYPSEHYRQCRCNYCLRTFPESEILVEDGTGDEYCPECLTQGFIMDLEGQE
ncbi:MAG: hypothetical protein IJ592_03430 [Candidatus Methanomethylophilaceae archaeon]|nr:hypothetical protein [Candidatus Methanomethylophilaceae archaeon]